MTPNAEQRRAVAGREPWATAPVVVGRHRRRFGWVLVVCVLVAAVTLAVLQTPSPPVTPPAPVARPDADASVPFEVAVEVTDVAAMDNDGLFGRDVTADDDAADAAARDIGAVVQAYLDAQFVTPETRFSDQPLNRLLTEAALRALSRDDLPGLGVLGLAVRQVEAGPVMATARVLTKGSDAVLAEVRYDARALVVSTEGAPVQLRQRATMVFVSEDGEWRAEAVTAELDLPLAPGRVGT